MLDKTNMAAMILADAPTPPEGFRSYTLTVTAAADNVDYVFTVTFDTTVVTYTINSGVGATTSSIAAAIRLALTDDTDNDGFGVMADVLEEGGGAGATAIIKGKIKGAFFTVAIDTANMTLIGPADAAPSSTEVEATTNAIVGASLAVALNADQNNYNPFTAGAPETLLVLTPNASPRNITGIVPYHRSLILVNASTTNTIQLAHESGSSAAANQFSLNGATSFVIQPRNAAILVYDDINSKWRLVR